MAWNHVKTLWADGWARLGGTAKNQVHAVVDHVDQAVQSVTQGRSADAAATTKTKAETAAQLRESVCTTISAWASEMGPVGVAASGGLDSSIVAAALAAGRHPFGCGRVDVVDRHPPAAGGEHLGDAFTNTGAGAGDEDAS